MGQRPEQAVHSPDKEWHGKAAAMTGLMAPTVRAPVQAGGWEAPRCGALFPRPQQTPPESHPLVNAYLPSLLHLNSCLLASALSPLEQLTGSLTKMSYVKSLTRVRFISAGDRTLPRGEDYLVICVMSGL